MTEQKRKPVAPTKKHTARLERERKQVSLVRTIAFAMFGVIVLLLAYGYLDTTYLQLRKAIVEVNGEKITVQQWQERVQLERSNILNQYQRYQYFQQQFGMDVSQQLQQLQLYLQYPEQLGQQVMDQMIDETLIRQEATRLGITVSDAEVEEAIQTSYRFFPSGTPTPTITPTAFEYPTFTSQQLTLYPHTATPTKVVTVEPSATPTLDPSITPTVTATLPPPTVTFTAAPPTPTFVPEDVTPTSTPYTLDGFKTDYQTALDRMKGFGVSEKTLRGIYEVDLLRQKLLDAVIADQPKADEQALARHILIDDATLAETVRQQLLNGKDFAEAALEYSKDTGSAAEGGSLGWFGKGMMVPEFEDAAFSQKIGEIGPLVQTQFGYHIIQVIARQELPLTATQYEQKRNTAFTAWLQSIRDTADIIIKDGWQSLIPPMPNFSN